MDSRSNPKIIVDKFFIIIRVTNEKIITEFVVSVNSFPRSVVRGRVSFSFVV